MPAFTRTVFLGHDLLLCLADVEWGAGYAVTYRLGGVVQAGRSGRENRWPRHAVLRHTLECGYLLPAATAAELQDALINLGTPTEGDRVFVGLPLAVDQLAPAEWATRTHDAEWVVNYDETGYTIHAKDSIPAEPARAWLAPLVVGRLAERPRLTPMDEGQAMLRLKLIERAPWDFRIAPAAEAGVGADWPALLEANWRELPGDWTEDFLTYEDLGDGRVEAVDGQEGAVRRGQEFLLTLSSRAQVRTLLNFFLARKGRTESFTAPWLHKPGDDTPTTPHSTKARFAQEELRLAYEHPALAEARVPMLQVPWEIAGVAGETPAQAATAWLYKLWLDVPGGPVVWRYTSWEQDLARAGDGTYLGGSTQWMRHNQLTQTIDLSDEPATLASWIFAGNPLVRALQRTLDVPLHLEIRKGTPAAPDAATLEYVGEIAPVSMDGRRLTVPTKVLGGLLDVKVPGFFFGPTCNYQFCGAGCTLDPNDWTFAGTIVGQSGSELTVTITSNPPAAALVNDYFAKAWVKKGAADTYELRQIVRSVDLGAGQQKFTLKKPLRAFVVGEAVSFLPYCTGTRAECQDKFDNYVNFGGHPHIAPRNLSVPARQTSTPTGKK